MCRHIDPGNWLHRPVGKNASYDIRVRAGEYMLIGVKEENLSFEGGERLLKINED